jgi:hypothetical protein
MYVQSVNLQAGDIAVVNCSAVCRGTENAKWAQFTPGGNVTLTLSRKASGAKDFFTGIIGKEVYVDISLADDPNCTQCGESVIPREGTNVHLGNDQVTGGYAPDEYVHQACLAAAKERLGV